ncbi:MAG: cysteine peptidase family C39 domain-containing protein [Acidobacteriota bacterium]|nr:cysteine peptidase family C39 domain-containing protein [Acidobacteriota bacterium]
MSSPSDVRRLVIIAVILTAAVPVPSAPGQTPTAALHLVDVPYLPQSESLCGGAAIAMVMRYWGAANVYAETFADLVDPAAGGIRGDDLVRALRSRGWTAESFRGDPATVQAYLRARRPVVALIQDRPGRFHYVVIVGWSRGRVIVHDPARAPFRVLDEKAFGEAWTESGNWTLAATPPVATTQDSVGGAGASEPARADSPESGLRPDAPCGGMVDEGVRLAGAGDVTGARRILEVAAETCPDAAGPWREMAGLHALGSDWQAAALDARKALERDPGDALAARILATALYLESDAGGALAAWNRVGEPIVDLVNVTGLERTRYAVPSHMMALRPRSLLTPEILRTARRKLAELPAAQTTRVNFRPGDSGRAQIDAVVLERPLLPSSPPALAAMGLHALTDREASIGIASPSGGGEMWRAAWRWWEHRPRLALGLDAPAPVGGVWGISVFGERQSYARAGSTFEESRRRVAFTWSNWIAAGLRLEGTVALDRMREARRHSGGETFAASGAAQQWFDSDCAYVEARVGYWAGDANTWTFSLGSEWRSRTKNEGQVWIARAGGDLAASDAPLALWPGAGTGQARDVLLRAHPLLDEGIVGNGAFGRRLIHGGVESRLWLQPARKPIRLAPAVFLDAARSSRGLEPVDKPWQFDAGAGIRLALPGSGMLRIDVAHGLRDGRNALSIGWAK